MAEPVIAARGVSKSFAGVQALDTLDLEIAPGEIHSLAGENGSGKSTLIKLMSGVYEPDTGTIELGGQSYRRLTPSEVIHHGIQVIYQDFAVFPNLTVMENLALNSMVARRRKFVSRRAMRDVAREAVSKINFKVDLDARLGDLPVADKQLVAISRALMSETKLIVMDEPTTALTGREIQALFRVILDLKQRGISTLFVSHKLDELFQISDRFTVIRNGKKVITSPTSELDRRTLSHYMTGREYDETPYEPADLERAEVLLEARDLSLAGAFEDVSFSLRRGETLGITGLLGSGRTELALALVGAVPASSGEIRVRGEATKLRSIRSAIKHGIAYVPEDRLTEGLMLDRSIGDNIVITKLDELSSAVGFVDNTRRSAEIERWLSELRIATRNPDNAVRTLSGGNQQRVVLAKWLAIGPDVLVLNGPTVGVDIGSKDDIHRILRELAKAGMAVVVISDDKPELLQTCGRVLLLKEGHLVQEIDTASVTEDELSDLILGDYVGIE